MTGFGAGDIVTVPAFYHRVGVETQLIVLIEQPRGGHAMTDSDRLHVAQRPLWLCRVCAAEWPCPTARARLSVEYAADRVGLRVYLAGLMIDAIDDFALLRPNPGPDPKALFTRFLIWSDPEPMDTRLR